MRGAGKIPQDRHQNWLRALCRWESLIQSQFQEGGEEKEQACHTVASCYPEVYGDPMENGLADTQWLLSKLNTEL